MSVNITLTESNGRTLVSTGSAWEPKMGYSRAVKMGNHIAVTGTVGANADGTYSPEMAAQARRSLEIIEAALKSVGAELTNVVRTRMYVTDISRWQEVAQAHGEVFADIRPATTIVEVARLIDDGALIEIEADAILP